MTPRSLKRCWSMVHGQKKTKNTSNGAVQRSNAHRECRTGTWFRRDGSSSEVCAASVLHPALKLKHSNTLSTLSPSSSSHSPMILRRALPLLLGVHSFCRAFHARPFIATPKQPHGARRCCDRLNMNMNNPAEVPEKLRLANLKAHNEVWDSRRDMARATLSAAKAFRRARESLAGPADGSNDSNLLEEGKGSLVISAIALAVAAATLRLGGRAALISVRMCLEFASTVAAISSLSCSV